MAVWVTQLIDGEVTGEFYAFVPEWAKSDQDWLDAKAAKEDWNSEWEGDVLHTWKEYGEGPVKRKDRYFRIV